MSVKIYFLFSVINLNMASTLVTNGCHSNGDLTYNSSSSSINDDYSGCEQITQTRKYRRLSDRIHDRIKAATPFFSLEFFPPKTNNGAVNLISR